ncbi:MAG: hypothetical protein WCG50_00420 [Rhodoferax sp.]|uniref:hypothetical protein n=1 Tax=Rhodoferax sp. TaxID=50421 RepID=UPI0030192EAA
MQPTVPTQAHWAKINSSHWYRWRGYMVRWLIFAGVVGMFQPVDQDLENYWLQKLYQGLFGLFFGAVCAVVFTLAENKLNVARIKWKSWSIVIATWLTTKLVFVSVMAAIG